MTINQQPTYVCDEEKDYCCPTEASDVYNNNDEQKLLEMYVFIDPLCPECWALEPIMKKMKMEYGRYLAITPVLANDLNSFDSSCRSGRSLTKDMAKAYHETACRTGMPCDGDVWHENSLSTPETAISAIKAAELQGKGIGTRYMRRVREALFLHKENIAEEEVLINCAFRVKGMDVREFVKDLHSATTKKALQDDKELVKEMNIVSAPSIVFFGEDVNEPGLKVEGMYNYSVYEEILEDMTDKKLSKCSPVPLEEFVSFYSLVATKEIAVVYDLKLEEAHREMRKLQLQRKVEEIPAKHGSIWRSLY